MRFDPLLADIRFGCGRSPAIAPPQDVDQILAGLRAPDDMAQRFPIERFDAFLSRLQARQVQRRLRREATDPKAKNAAREEIRVLNRQAYRDHLHWLAAHIARRSHSETPFLERLEGFWADHFTAVGKDPLMQRAGSPYSETALRPNLSGQFETLLFEAVTHPVMVAYLDQRPSTGPGSERAMKSGGKAGLNENLAREVLELHTLGVDGPYSQRDVRELAELLTGLTYYFTRGRAFARKRAEPGPETVLGRVYGGDDPQLRDIRAVLRDLARHPATAQHISRKLAMHFVSDRPDPDLVEAMTQTWLQTDGDLMAVYTSLLRHDASWRWTDRNVKRPFEFITSACRALAVPAQALTPEKPGQFRNRFVGPLQLMGHRWQRPDSPDGLEELDAAWITPQGVAARLQWAVAVPSLLLDRLPDPRAFAEVALGADVPEAVRFAARAAESRADGVGLILASPAFQRM